jgi:hypothetical protein
MKLAQDERSLSNYPPTAPRGRGAQATLTSHRLIWLQDTQEEHYPLSHITGVTYGYERMQRRISWALALLIGAAALAVFLGWAQSNLPTLAESMVKTLADSENPERIAAARRAYDQRVDAMMLMIMPLWGVAGAVLAYAAWLLYTGIRGETRVVITAYATIRNLSRRGHDPGLLEFGEQAAQRVAGLEPTVGLEPELEPVMDSSMIDWIPPKKKR